ncbi:MAG: hypothetical protein ISR95_00945 [Candidatus Marinimicrobia bacterium]|nr:hypothetical protein [Candidatus Neomarinimicrobiota bacterium]
MTVVGGGYWQVSKVGLTINFLNFAEVQIIWTLAKASPKFNPDNERGKSNTQVPARHLFYYAIVIMPLADRQASGLS